MGITLRFFFCFYFDRLLLVLPHLYADYSLQIVGPDSSWFREYLGMLQIEQKRLVVVKEDRKHHPSQLYVTLLRDAVCCCFPPSARRFLVNPWPSLANCLRLPANHRRSTAKRFCSTASCRPLAANSDVSSLLTAAAEISSRRRLTATMQTSDCARQPPLFVWPHLSPFLPLPSLRMGHGIAVWP